MTEQYVVMRLPLLMEDEGRTFLVFGPAPRSECEDWLDKNTKDTDYFKRGDYQIVPF